MKKILTSSLIIATAILVNGCIKEFKVDKIVAGTPTTKGVYLVTELGRTVTIVAPNGKAERIKTIGMTATPSIKDGNLMMPGELTLSLDGQIIDLGTWNADECNRWYTDCDIKKDVTKNYQDVTLNSKNTSQDFDLDVSFEFTCDADKTDLNNNYDCISATITFLEPGTGKELAKIYLTESE